MTGTLHLTHQGWIVRWSDLHSFGHGWHMMDTLIHPDQQPKLNGATGNLEGTNIDFDTVVSDNFTLYAVPSQPKIIPIEKDMETICGECYDKIGYYDVTKQVFQWLIDNDYTITKNHK
jgi:hypothetical protein